MDANYIVETHKITMKSVTANSNPNMPDWKDARHYRITLYFNGRKITTPYTRGSALPNEFTAGEVLDCWINDARSIESSRNYGDWCNCFGYDQQSPEAQRTYKAVKRHTEQLRQFLAEHYDYIIENVEGL